MSNTASAPPEPSSGPPSVDPHDDPFLAHHFGSAKQQFDAGKLGIWLFLITEVLFFSGLFCAYAVYRRTHPEAFANADQYLDVTLGATNTAILIFSSLTMAWAVRAAQLGQTRLLLGLLTVTLSCASLFLGVKAVEYSHKWDEGILWADYFNPTGHAEASYALLTLSSPAALVLLASGIAAAIVLRRGPSAAGQTLLAVAISAALFFGGVGIGQGLPALQAAVFSGSESTHEHGAHDAATHHDADHQVTTQTGDNADSEHAEHHETDSNRDAEARSAHDDASKEEKQQQSAASPNGADVATDLNRTYTGIFFSIYYMMTGLHAIHILAGMGAITWLIYRAAKHHFSARYFGPVDYVGLYWHLVDLVWIFLFPLLYLIG